jgi:hypothetical protein
MLKLILPVALFGLVIVVATPANAAREIGPGYCQEGLVAPGWVECYGPVQGCESPGYSYGWGHWNWGPNGEHSVWCMAYVPVLTSDHIAAVCLDADEAGNQYSMVCAGVER